MKLFDRNSSPNASVNTAIDAVKMADDYGFDTAWFAEQEKGDSSCPSALLMIARCVRETRRIKLGAAISKLSGRTPKRLSREVAFAELLAAGRLSVGIGPGFDIDGVESSHASCANGSRDLEEFLKTFKQDFQEFVDGESQDDLDSRDWLVSSLRLSPPELLLGSSDSNVIALAARIASALVVQLGDGDNSAIEKSREELSRVALDWTSSGGDLSHVESVLRRYVHVTDDKAEIEYVEQCLERRTSSQLVRPVIGPSARCLEILQQEITTHQPHHLWAVMGIPGLGREQVLAAVESFGADVLPKLFR